MTPNDVSMSVVIVLFVVLLLICLRRNYNPGARGANDQKEEKKRKRESDGRGHEVCRKRQRALSTFARFRDVQSTKKRKKRHVARPGRRAQGAGWRHPPRARAYIYIYFVRANVNKDTSSHTAPTS
jgi:hypothetical protein